MCGGASTYPKTLFLRGHNRRICKSVTWRSQYRHFNWWEPKAISWDNIWTISNLHPCLDKQFRLRTSFHRSRKTSPLVFRDVPQLTGHYFIHFIGKLLHNRTSIGWDKKSGVVASRRTCCWQNRVSHQQHGWRRLSSQRGNWLCACEAALLPSVLLSGRGEAPGQGGESDADTEGCHQLGGRRRAYRRAYGGAAGVVNLWPNF